MSPFTRSGFLRLVRPASNALSRRAPSSFQTSVLVTANGSGVTIPSIGLRRISSSPILNQSTAESLQTAELRSSSIPMAEETATDGLEEHSFNVFQPGSVSIEDVMAKYNEAKSNDALTSSADYEAFLKQLCVENSFKECYGILKEMKDAGIPVTPNCYGYVLKSGRRSLRISEIRALFGRPLPRREVNDNNLSSIGEPSQFFEKFNEIKQMMIEDGVELEGWFWDDFAASLSSTNQGGLLINLALALEERGITPSTMFYNKMLYTLPRCGFGDRADLLFSRMVLNKVANLQSYVVRLGSLVFMARYDEAEKLFGDMCKHFSPNDVAYNTIIHAYLREKQIEKALKVLEIMKQSENAKPGNVTANTFVAYFHESGSLEYAKEVLDYFRLTVGYPKEMTEKATLFKFFARYEPSKASELLTNIVAQYQDFGIEIYNALFAVLIDRRVPSEWKRTLGNIPLDKTYPPALEGLSEVCTSLPYHFRHLIGRMEAYGVKPNAVTYDYLIKALGARKDFTSVMTIYQDLSKSNTAMFSSHHNAYLTALLMTNAAEADIQAFLTKMRVKRWPVSSINHRRLDEANIKLPLGSFVYNY